MGLLHETKGEVFQHFLNFKTLVEKEKGNIKCLRSMEGENIFQMNSMST